MLNAPHEKSLLNGKRWKNLTPEKVWPLSGLRFVLLQEGGWRAGSPQPLPAQGRWHRGHFPNLGGFSKRVLPFPEELQGLRSHAEQDGRCRFEPMACSSLSIPLPPAHGGLGAAAPLTKILLWKANGDPAQGPRCLWGRRKGPVSPESTDILEAGGAPGCSALVGAVLWHVGGVFPERGGCCPGTAGAQALGFGELPPFRQRIQLQPRGRAPPVARLAQQGHPGSCSRSPGHALLPALALGRAGRRRQGWHRALGGSASTPPDGPIPGIPVVEGWCKYPVAFLIFGGVSGRLENEQCHPWVDSSGL